jgi:hypothetical protein
MERWARARMTAPSAAYISNVARRAASSGPSPAFLNEARLCWWAQRVRTCGPSLARCRPAGHGHGAADRDPARRRARPAPRPRGQAGWRGREGRFVRHRSGRTASAQEPSGGRHRISALRADSEHIGDIDVGAAGRGDVGRQARASGGGRRTAWRPPSGKQSAPASRRPWPRSQDLRPPSRRGPAGGLDHRGPRRSGRSRKHQLIPEVEQQRAVNVGQDVGWTSLLEHDLVHTSTVGA